MSIGIVGLGYVGLPLAMEFAEAGVDVIGIDVDAQKVAALRAAARTSRTCRTARLQAALGRCSFSTRFVDLHDAEAVLICVPTPLTANREPELGPLLSAARALGGVDPRAARRSCSSRRRSRAPRASTSCRCSRSPACAPARTSRWRSRPSASIPGRTDYTIRTTPKIVGGLTERCTERAVAIYRRVCERIVPVGSPEAAEMAKLLENIFRSVNIALVNEMAMLADRMGIDIWEVVDAASTKPLRLHALRAGPRHGRPLPARSTRST